MKLYDKDEVKKAASSIDTIGEEPQKSHAATESVMER